MSNVKKNASAGKSAKNMSESDKKEVLEEIMEELEQSAKDKKESKAEESAGEEKENSSKAGEAEKADKANEAEESKEPEEGKEPEDPKAEAPGEKKKGFFSKKDKKNPLQEKVDELNDRLMRQVAEFDNFRKRTDKEKSQMFEQGQSNVLGKLLPVVDNFERGLAAVPEQDKDGAFADGMNKIYKQLMKQLEDLGVSPIEAVGEEFDPNLHNAVMQVDSEEYESGVVAQELQKGYMFHDMVLRHSMVAVAK